jgi:putative oxidoreductase
MSETRRNFERFALPLLRIGGSSLMMIHGFSKLEMLLNDEKIEFYNFMGLGDEVSLILAVIGELLAPLLLVIGLKTRLAALIAAVTMAVAAFGAHAGDGIEDREHSLIYLILFLSLVFSGAGKWSVDEFLSRKKNPKK